MAETSEELPVDIEVVGTLCDPCQEDGVHLTAEGFCVDCNDYLCLDCFQTHRKPKPSRHHVLQNKASMPVSKPFINQDAIPNLKCPAHKNQSLFYYCKLHDQVLCELCKQFDHRDCNKHEHLVELSNVRLDDEEFKDIRGKIAELEAYFQDNKTTSIRKSDSIKSSYDQIVTALTKIRDTDLEMVNGVHSTCYNMVRELKSTGGDLDKLSAAQNVIPLFVTLKFAKPRLETTKSTLKQVRNHNRMFKYTFKSDDKTHDSSYGDLGTLKKCPIKESIGVRTKTDNSDCCICGMDSLCDNKLAITDSENSKIKLVDLTIKSVISELNVEMQPWDLTYTGDNKIAVTAWEKSEILIVTVSETWSLSTLKTIDVGSHGYGRGIVCHHDTLIVSMWKSSQIKIFNFDGELLKSLEDKESTVELSCPRYLALNTQADSLYVCDDPDSGWNEICSMTLDGKIKHTFQHEILKEPRGMAVAKDGRIFLCTRKTHEVYEISPDLDKAKVLFDENHGLSQPHGIAYDSNENRLFVGGYKKNTIEIFWL